MNGQELLAFRRDPQNRLELLSNFPAVLYQHTSVANNGAFNQTLIISCLCVMALTLLFWPAGALIRRHYHHRLEIEPHTVQGRLWIRLICTLNIILVLGMLTVLSG